MRMGRRMRRGCAARKEFSFHLFNSVEEQLRDLESGIAIPANHRLRDHT